MKVSVCVGMSKVLIWWMLAVQLSYLKEGEAKTNSDWHGEEGE
jgi:hypothetical protein